MTNQIKDICLNLCAQIRATDRSRMHWRRSVIRLAASARYELRKLRLAARVPGADELLLTLADQLEAELNQVLRNEGR